MNSKAALPGVNNKKLATFGLRKNWIESVDYRYGRNKVRLLEKEYLTRYNNIQEQNF